MKHTLMNPWRRLARLIRKSPKARSTSHPHRLVLESLEDRTNPVVQLVTLGDISFYGDFTQTGTSYQGDGTTNPIQIGLEAADLSSFTPLVTIDQSVNFDTQNNTDGTFTASGDLASYGSTPSNSVDLWTNLDAVNFVGSELVDITGGGLAVPGTKQQVDVGLGSISFVPDHLFFADATRTGTVDQPWLQGSITIPVLGNVAGSVGGDSNFVTFDSGGVAGLAAVLNEKFSVGNLEFSVDDLSVDYTRSAGSVAVTGVSDFQLNSNKVSVDLGSGNTSGLVISDGSIESFDMEVTGDFSLFGLTITSKGLTFEYQGMAGPNTFKMFGDLEVTSSDSGMDDVTATFGTDNTDAGLVVTSGDVQSVNIELNGTFQVFGLTFVEQDLTFIYNSTNTRYELFGTAEVKSSDGGLDENISFFDATDPGLLIENGNISQVKIDLTGDFKVFGLTFTEKDLTFTYDRTGGQYELYGAAEVKSSDGGLDENITFFDATDPGLLIQNGNIEQVKIDLTGTFTVFGLTFVEQDLTFQYDRTGGQYELYGAAEVKSSEGGIDENITFFDASHPGLLIQNGAIQQVMVDLTGNFTVFGLTFTEKDLTFKYERTDALYEVYGTVQVRTSDGGLNETASFFDASDPGLLIQNGTIEQVKIDLNGTFNVFGLTITEKDLTFEYEKNLDQYAMSGEVTVSTSNGDVIDKLDATFGDGTTPGLLITSNVIDTIDLTINKGSQFDLFGLTVSVNDVHIQYDRTNTDENGDGIMQITNPPNEFGIVAVDVFSAKASLPQQQGTSGGGILVDLTTGVVTVDDVIIEIDNVKLGAFTVKEFSLAYLNGGAEIDASFDMLFPANWEVSGGLQLVDHKIHNMNVKFQADGDNPGIAIGDTGLFLTGADASIQNIDNPSNLTVSGDIFVRFGDPVTIFGKTAAIFSAEGSFFVDKDELKLDADVYMGSVADKNGVPSTTGILGTGHGELLLDWGAGVYSLDANISLLDGDFSYGGTITFDSSAELVIQAKADVNVPHGIPFIGGKELGELDLLFKFDPKASPADNFVAAWTKVNLIFKKVEIGFQYTFEENKAEVIGAGTINADLRDQSSDPSKPYVYSQSFMVPSSGATQATLTADWSRAFPAGATLTNPTVTVTGTTSAGSVVVNNIAQNAFSETNGLSLLPQTSGTLTRQVGVVGNSSNDLVPLNVGPNGT